MPGHWEGDLLSGPNNTYIATLVERHTRDMMLANVAGKDTQKVVTALIKQAMKLPKELSYLRPPFYDRSVFDRSRTAGPDAAGWLRLRHSFRAVVVRGGASEPCLPLVLSARVDGEVPDHSTFPKK